MTYRRLPRIHHAAGTEHASSRGQTGPRAPSFLSHRRTPTQNKQIRACGKEGKAEGQGTEDPALSQLGGHTGKGSREVEHFSWGSMEGVRKPCAKEQRRKHPGRDGRACAKALWQELLGIPRNFREISIARAFRRWGGDLERVRVEVQMRLGVQWVV